ncbi:Alpha/Beta hydrolase protein [Dactylonectria macrodidyma]|uniref:Carboxylic ester hydrolase n=1 Tax=Dactylonectria macrodidyma TaxID=307937 RepID=A0A9P9DJN3_9HYPO|nr:Alpha/Beta hydrolase protein [Dactylonectria macrodidyma]
MASVSKIVLFGLGLLGSAAASQHSAPKVSVKNGTYAGTYSAQYDQDYFLGMPYAQPPERFALAKSLDSSWKGVHQAIEYPPHCYGYGSDQIGYEQSEDCLYLNVVRPAGIKSTAGLPVGIWIHGGGLFMGGSGDRRYNLSFIVDRSVEMGTPMIGVSINYRLSAFGFLSGDEASDAGVTNNGFRDQRLALRWINENIRSFGGSPKKVTIFGESSGAESVSAQVFAYNGRDDGLFRAAMAESGFGGALGRYPGGFNATEYQQATYDALVGNVTSCSSLVGSGNALACLREAPFEEINYALNVSAVAPWPPVLDNDFIADYPTNQINKGRFPKIPLLVGANSDEGTAFGQGKGPNGGGVNTDDEMRDAIAAIFPDDVEDHTGKPANVLIDELMEAYPDDQTVGIPSLKTWPHIIEPNDTYAQAFGLQYRRTAALFGDYMMAYQRRRSTIAWAKHGVPSYVYRFDVTVNGVSAPIGATHFQEVAFVFHNLNGDGYATNPFGGTGTYPEKAKALSKTMSTAWINFVTGLDPNGKGGHRFSKKSNWPVYDVSKGKSGKGVVFDLDGSSVEADNWRAEGMAWFAKHSLDVFGN